MIHDIGIVLQKLSISLGLLSTVLATTPSAEYVVILPEPPVPVIHSQEDVRTYIIQMADYYGIDHFKVLFIAQHESRFGWQNGYFDPAIRGPEKIGASYGVWQFYNQNKGFNKACATDLQCSTRQAMEWLKDGRENEWSAWRFRYQFYKDECDIKTKSCQ